MKISKTKDKNQQFYAYYDAIEETGEVIYCGKGIEDRIYNLQRNNKYNNIANKHKIIRTIIPMLDEDLALKYEDWLMEYYHTWVDDPLCSVHACNFDGPGTNISCVTQSKESIAKRVAKNTGKKRTPEQRERQRQAALNRKPDSKETCEKRSFLAKNRSKEHQSKLSQALSKQVYQIELLTNIIIAKYQSIVEASRVTGINKSCIGRCCNYNKNHTRAGNFIWRFVTEWDKLHDIYS